MSIGIVTMGLLAGFLVGLTGVGAASLLTPFLVLIGIHPSLAVGTDLVYNSITKLFGTIQHWRQRTIHFRLVKYLACGSIPGAVSSIILMQLWRTTVVNEETLIKHALGYVLMVAAVATIVRILFDKRLYENRYALRPFEQKRGITILIGLIFGFMVGLTSIGSGSLFAVALLYLFRLSAPELVGNDIAHAFLLATAAGVLNIGFGQVNYPLVANLLAGSIPGVLFGSTLSAKVPAKPLRTAISIIIFIGGLKLI